MMSGEIPVFGGNGINGYHNNYNTDEISVTIGRVGAYCGAVHITPEYAWITDNCFKVYYSKNNIDTKFLSLHLKYMNLGQSSFKGAQPVISGKRIYSRLTQIPPLPEQKCIVAKLDELMAYCDSLEESIKKSQKQNEMLLGQVLREALEPTR
jgi:type I restriction enzyme S subunit